MDDDIPDVLARLCKDTRAETERRKAMRDISDLKGEIHAAHDRPRGFGSALKEAAAARGFGLIAEIKKASPSGGSIRQIGRAHV